MLDLCSYYPYLSKDQFLITENTDSKIFNGLKIQRHTIVDLRNWSNKLNILNTLKNVIFLYYKA